MEEGAQMSQDSIPFVFAIRQKSTGYFLPIRWKSSRGYTHDEPEPSFPRLLPSLLSAKRALAAWLRGEWSEDTYIGDWGAEESYGPSPSPKPERDRNDMEIVRLSFRIEEVCE
jgi:hypothetical protein